MIESAIRAGVLEQNTVDLVDTGCCRTIEQQSFANVIKGCWFISDQTVQNILGVTARIVAAHLTNNQVDAAALPSLIQAVYRTLSRVDEPEAAPAAAQPPAVPVKKSVFPDFIVCLGDGKKLKTLKRHLQTSYGMTPDDYRTKWGLPRDYPMVAPNYASTRSALAKQIGLGRKPAEIPAEPVATQMPARRARGSRG